MLEMLIRMIFFFLIQYEYTLPVQCTRKKIHIQMVLKSIYGVYLLMCMAWLVVFWRESYQIIGNWYLGSLNDYQNTGESIVGSSKMSRLAETLVWVGETRQNRPTAGWNFQQYFFDKFELKRNKLYILVDIGNFLPDNHHQRGVKISIETVISWCIFQ